MLVIQSLRQLEQVRNKRITDSLYDNIPIPVPINIGTINGGAWPSSVADTVTLEGRCGIAPNESPEAVQSELENWLNDLQYHDEWFKHYPVDIEWFGAMWLPNDLAEDHELTKVLKSAYQTITAEAPLIEASPWATDGGILSHAGGTLSSSSGREKRKWPTRQTNTLKRRPDPVSQDHQPVYYELV